jgi:hypothetical protein
MEIGDRIIFKKNRFTEKCYYIDKVFKIESFSKSKRSIYYNFKITNNKCNCYLCRSRKTINSYSQKHIGLCSIGIVDIELVQSKIEFNRVQKINKIFYK